MCNPGFIGFIVIDTFPRSFFLLHDTGCGAWSLFFEDYPQCTHKYDPGVIHQIWVTGLSSGHSADCVGGLPLRNTSLGFHDTLWPL